MGRAMMACECGHTSQTHMARHIRNCAARPFAVRANELALANGRLIEQVQSLEAHIQRVEAENAALRARPTTVQNTIVNNGVINVLAYGQEPTPETRNVLRILLPAEESIARYIEMKHFCNQRTSNLRISNKRARTMQIVEMDASKRLRWTEKDKKRMLEKIVEDNIEELVDTHGAEQVASWKHWYRGSGLADEGYDKTEAWKRIQSDVENMLLSQKNINMLA